MASFSQGLFNLLNVVVGVMIIIGGVVMIIPFASFKSVMLAFYIMLFGIFNLTVELAGPSAVVTYMYFMVSWIGRGFFYIFCGTLILAGKGIELVACMTCLIVGILWVCLALVDYWPSPGSIMNAYGGSGRGYSGGRSYTRPAVSSSNKVTSPPPVASSTPRASARNATQSSTTNPSDPGATDYSRPAGYSSNKSKGNEGLPARVGRG